MSDMSPLGVPYEVVPLGLSKAAKAHLLDCLDSLDPEPYWTAEEQPRDGRLILTFTPSGDILPALGGDHWTYGMLLYDLTTGSVSPMRSADATRRP